MSSCLAVRVGAGAVVGYSLGTLTGSAPVAWILAAVAATAMYLWSRFGGRRAAGACDAGCAAPGSSSRRPLGRSAPREEAGPAGHAGAGRPGDADEPGAVAGTDPVVEPDRSPVGRRG